MNEFWILGQPDTPDAEKMLADWPKDEPLLFQRVDCTVDPEGHRGVRGRITSPISAVLPMLEPQDFVWTQLGECLVQRHVLDVFKDLGFTGYNAIPAKTRFKDSSREAPKLWELAVRGSAGLASPDSGLRILHTCPGCDLTDYSQITNPAKVVDESKWDHTDFFKVKPLEGWIFVTGRVVAALRKSIFTGWEAKSLVDMKQSFDIAIPPQK